MNIIEITVGPAFTLGNERGMFAVIAGTEQDEAGDFTKTEELARFFNRETAQKFAAVKAAEIGVVVV